MVENTEKKKPKTTQKCLKQSITSADCKRAGGKGPRQKTSKIVKERQKVFRHFSTIFAQGKKRQKSPKSVKKFFDAFGQFSRGTIVPALLGGSDNRNLILQGGHGWVGFGCSLGAQQFEWFQFLVQTVTPGKGSLNISLIITGAVLVPVPEKRFRQCSWCWQNSSNVFGSFRFRLCQTLGPLCYII